MTKIITEKKYRFEIPEGQGRERIDVYLANNLEYATRNRMQQLIKAELCTVNGKIVKTNYKVNPGDDVLLRIPCSPRPEKTLAEDIPLDIIYEDDDLLIVNKSANMCVHPSIGNHTGTLVNALMHYTTKLSHVKDGGRPGIVHRIDKDTSGLLVIARDEWIHSEIAKQFAAHTSEREYWAVVWGRFKEPKGEVIGNIGRSKKDRKVFTVHETEGKHAHTFYEIIEEFEFATLIKLRLKTGRTHQIRVHMNHINKPIFGDPWYGGRAIAYAPVNVSKMKARVENLLEIMPRQALHAKTLGFIHPRTQKMVNFDSPLPKDFEELLIELRKTSFTL